MKNIAIVFILSLVFFSGKIYSQVALSYYPIQSIVSVSSNTENLFWADLRIESNTFISNINMEFDLMVNIERTDWLNYYTGIGINVNPFYGLEELPITNGYLVLVGGRAKPIQSHKNFHIIFEVSTYSNKYFDGGTFRTLLGVSYNI